MHRKTTEKLRIKISFLEREGVERRATGGRLLCVLSTSHKPPFSGPEGCVLIGEGSSAGALWHSCELGVSAKT